MSRNRWEDISPEGLERIDRARFAFDLNLRRLRNPPAAPLLRRVQADLFEWQVKNFGMPSETMLTAGITEEIGEFAEVAEAIHGSWTTGEATPEETAAWLEAVTDAFGDLCVYACNYCSRLGLDWHTIVDGMLWGSQTPIIISMSKKDPRKALGRIAHASLKYEQKIRGYAGNYDRVELVVGDGIAELIPIMAFQLWQLQPHGVTPLDAFLKTARHVLKRDWNADPLAGGEAA